MDEKIFHHDDDDCKCQKLIAASIREGNDDIARALLLIAKSIQELVPPPEPEAVAANLTYSIGGVPMGNPVTGAPGNTATPTFTESAADGSSVAPIGPVQYASDNTAVVTVDASTGIATLQGAGIANVSALDTGNGLTDSVAFTVTPTTPVAVSASLNYSLNPSRRR
jgi:hypothetical protein